MTLSTTQTKVVYIPDGAQTRYAVPFPLFDARDVACIAVSASGKETPLTAFAVEGLGRESGVYVRFYEAPEAGGSLVIRRSTRLVQETDYPEGGKFPSAVVERDFDRVTGMIQELQEEVDRAVKVSADQDDAPNADAFSEDIRAFADAAEQSALRAEAAADQANAVLPQVVAAGEEALGRVRAEGEIQVERATEEADRAEAAASQIPGFAENAYAIFGLRYGAGFTLEAYRSEPEESVYTEEYLAVSVLPASCRLSVEAGRVKLYIPFTT